MRDAGEGRLICVAGPSGAGKDTLIKRARAHFAGDPRFVFPSRAITRPPAPDEPHTQLTEAEFLEREARGGFFLSWRAHGVAYGLGADIGEALAAGRAVIVNISRLVAGEARAKWPRTSVILVTADPAVLRSRLEARGRDSGKAVEARLRRAAALEGDAIAFDNSGGVERAAEAFSRLLGELADGR